ncbi:hypothetical protein RIF29_35448 [Crotalaria pallida]|uniref:BHLH domain-containing protein n=1 Tax=Crotalaria pallida TaxID=3830 RepID=A0AAN9E9X9_CROPI
MLRNTSSNSSSITTENLSQKISPSSSISSFRSQILSFDNNTTQFYGFDCTLNPPTKQNEVGNTHFSAQTTKGFSKNQNFEAKTVLGKRSGAHTHDHIIAERKRREKLSHSFIALAGLIPGLKKMDKASVLRDAIKYVKELKDRVTTLEEDKKKTRVVVLNEPQQSGDDDDSSSDEPLLQVVARISGKEVLLRIHCERQNGILVKILALIQSLNLFVANSSVLPFGDSTLEITLVAQMGEDYNLSIKDLVKNVRTATWKCISPNNVNVGHV